jgi:hypothetical protein
VLAVLSNPARWIWFAVLLLVIGASFSMAPRYVHSSVEAVPYHVHMSFARQSDDEENWQGSRYRCVICHTRHQHNVTMAHPLNPNCLTCHSGSPTAVGCPSCHSVHAVEYPHEVYTNCDECHAGETIAYADVHDTTVGYLAFVFSRSDYFLFDYSGLLNDYTP